MSKYLIIPKGNEKPFQKLLLTPWNGIDAIEIASGDFIIGEVCIPELIKSPVNITISNKEVSAKTELLKYPLADETTIVFKIYETIEEPIIIEK